MVSWWTISWQKIRKTKKLAGFSLNSITEVQTFTAFIRGPGGENYLLSDVFPSDRAEYMLLISVNL